MKRLTVVTGMLALALAISATAAEKKNHFYLGAGLALPNGDFGDAYKMGLHAEGGYGFQVSPKLEIVPTVAFHTFGFDDNGTGASGDALNIIMFGGNAKLNFGTEGKKTNPFVYGGLGMANGKSGGASSTDLYFSAGGGLDIVSSEAMSFFAKAGFVSVSSDGASTTYLPVTFGVRF